MAEDTVHVGKGGRRRKARWLFIVAIIAAVVLATGAGIGLRWLQNRGNKPAETDLPQLPPIIAKSQELALGGDFAGAQQEVAEQLAKPNLSNEEKYELYYQQGANYANQQKYQEALDSYKLAAAIKESQSLAESMAVISELLGNKQAAIDYYKQAIQLIPQDDAVRESDKERYENKIRELGGQP